MNKFTIWVEYIMEIIEIYILLQETLYHTQQKLIMTTSQSNLFH